MCILKTHDQSQKVLQLISNCDELLKFTDIQSFPPPNYVDLSLEWFTNFKHVVQSLLKTYLSLCPFLNVYLATHHSI